MGEGPTLRLPRGQVDRVNYYSILFAEWVFSNISSTIIQRAVDRSPAVEVRGKVLKK
jgi:hypothetical protein